MKNISRRVFIKGMAVAAVATAASTVLTGCKLPVTPEEPTVDTTTQSFTVADPTDSKKTLVITAEKMEYNSTLTNDQVAAIDVKVVNDTQQPIAFTKAYTSNKVDTNGYQIVVTAYLNGEEGTAGAVQAGTTTYVDNFVTATTDTVIVANGSNTVTKYGKVIVTAPATYDWSKVTVKMDVYKVVKKDASADEHVLVETGKFNFNV